MFPSAILTRPSIYITVLGSCLLIGAIVTGCAGEKEASGDRTGADVYAATCEKCHGADGAGVNAAFPPLRNSAKLAGPVEPIAALVLRGGKGPVVSGGEVYKSVMSPLSFLTDEEIARVINYSRLTYTEATDSVDAASIGFIRSRTQGQAVLPLHEIWAQDYR